MKHTVGLHTQTPSMASVLEPDRHKCLLTTHTHTFSSLVSSSRPVFIAAASKKKKSTMALLFNVKQQPDFGLRPQGSVERLNLMNLSFVLQKKHKRTREPLTFLREKPVHIAEQSSSERQREGEWCGYTFSQRTKTGPHPPYPHMLRDTWACRLQSVCTRLSSVTQESINLISVPRL